MPFKLFLDNDGKPQFDDNGTPLFIQDGATEPTPISIDALHDQVRKVGGEAATSRREKEELAAKLKAYGDVTPEAVRENAEFRKRYDNGRLMDDGKVEELKQKILSDNQHQLDAMSKALDEERAGRASDNQANERVVHNLVVKNAFLSSKFLRERTSVPEEFTFDHLGKHFTVEYRDGIPVPIARDRQGNIIHSKANPLIPADSEEAIQFLVESHPNRDRIIANVAPLGGSGAVSGGSRLPGGGAKSIVDCKNEAEKIAYIKEKTAQ